MNKRHRALLDDYVAELRAAKAPVNAWWSRVVAAELDRTPNRVSAASQLRQRWPNGPATHPRIVAIVRKYFLACVHLNGQFPLPADEAEVQQIAPAVFVGEYLVSPDTQDVADIITHFKYWPVGSGEAAAPDHLPEPRSGS